jgi:hypothetical protein
VARVRPIGETVVAAGLKFRDTGLADLTTRGAATKGPLRMLRCEARALVNKQSTFSLKRRRD